MSNEKGSVFCSLPSLPLHDFFLPQPFQFFLVIDTINIMLPNTGDYVVDNVPNPEAVTLAEVTGDVKKEAQFRCQLSLGTGGVKVLFVFKFH